DHFIPAGPATVETAGIHGQLIGNGIDTSFVLYGISSGQLADAAALAHNLSTFGLGELQMNAPIDAHEHMLFPYVSSNNEVKIADLDFLDGTHNTMGKTNTTATATMGASDTANVR